MYKVAIIKQGKYWKDYQGPSLPLRIQFDGDRPLQKGEEFNFVRIPFWLHRVCKRCGEGQHEIHFFYVDLPTLTDSDCRELLDKGIKTYWRVI